MRNLRGAAAAGTLAGIIALMLGTPLRTAGAAPMARRVRGYAAGICASYGTHASTGGCHLPPDPALGAAPRTRDPECGGTDG